MEMISETSRPGLARSVIDHSETELRAGRAHPSATDNPNFHGFKQSFGVT
jgi:hypothetical protein